MLIQMPIFFGFLYMLYTAAELRNSGFLWVHDLSQPDTVAHLPIPGYGTLPINVLPLLMIGAQFWQMTLTPKTGDPSAAKRRMMFIAADLRVLLLQLRGGPGAVLHDADAC